MNVEPNESSDHVISYVVYLRDEIFFKLKRDGSLSGTRKPRHPNCTSAKSSNGADRLSPFRSGHMMRLRQHVGRYCLHLRIIHSLSAFCVVDITFLEYFLRYTAIYLTSFGESEISRIGRAKIPIS